MKRTDLLDTSLEMHRRRVEMLRSKGAVWRVQKAFELCDESIRLFPEQTKRAIRKLKRIA